MDFKNRRTNPFFRMTLNTFKGNMGLTRMSIEKLFSTLKDGTWHDIGELANQTGLQYSKLAEFSKFLSQQGLVAYEHEAKRLKMDPDWTRAFPIVETETTEPKDTLASFMIPPKTSLTVQATQISNLSTVALEITVRIKGDVKEIAVNL